MQTERRDRLHQVSDIDRMVNSTEVVVYNFLRSIVQKVVPDAQISYESTTFTFVNEAGKSFNMTPDIRIQYPDGTELFLEITNSRRVKKGIEMDAMRKYLPEISYIVWGKRELMDIQSWYPGLKLFHSHRRRG